MKKFEYLDSLRGIAILLVVLVHIGTYFDLPPADTSYKKYINEFIYNGRLGVQLFFIVSAYTLMLSYQHRMHENNRVLKFFIRRYFRIAPMYYVAVLYFTGVRFTGFNLSNIDFSNIPLTGLISNILFFNAYIPNYVNNYVPGGWSISVEFTFYLILIFLYSKIKNTNISIQYLTISIIIAYLFNEVLSLYYSESSPIYLYNFLYQLPVFLFGILVFQILKNKEDLNRRSLFFLLFTIFFFCYAKIPYHILYSIFLALLLFIQIKYNSKIFSNKILAHIGKVSFSIYLVHFAIIFYLRKIHIQHDANLLRIYNYNEYLYSMLLFILVFLLSYFIAIITYHLIEVPGQKVGKKIISKLDQIKN